MASNTIGKLTEFDPATDSVAAYVERAQLYFEANEIGEAKRVAVFLTAVGGKTYALLRNLLAPALPKDKTFDDIVEELKKHYQPKRLVIAERFYFHRRCQAAGETVADFVAELRRLTTHCEFGTHLDEALRDRFVCGLRSEATQKKLLTEAKLTFKQAVEIAQSMEKAAENARSLQSPTRAAGHQPVSQRDVCKVYSASSSEVTTSCYRCGKPNHKPNKCPFKSTKCHNCGKMGHLRRVCRSPPKKPSGVQKGSHPVKQIQEDTSTDQVVLCQVRTARDKPLEVDLIVGNKPLRMEVDTGSAVSLVSEETYGTLFPKSQLQPSRTRLQTYLGEPITVVGQRNVDVRYGEQQVELPLLVVKGTGPSLLGRDWLRTIRLDWKAIHHVRRGALQEVLDRHTEIFQPGLGTLKGYQATIHVDAGAKPRFWKARPVPYALRDKVEQELERLTQEGVIEPVQYSDWAAPIVPVLKDDGSVRICGDFKVTVNQASKLDKYPLPKIEDLFAKLQGGKSFTKLDLTSAYQQIVLEEESRQYVVINTSRGLFRYNRLPFGISSAPSVFQRVMECLLQGIPGVVVYIDDVLITGQSEEQHLAALDETLKRMKEAGLRLKKGKCVFQAPSVIYLGHRIDAEGLHPVADKLNALQDAPSPKSVSELKSYLGLLTYYAKFLPNLSTVLAPLYRLLKHREPWRWTGEQERAFRRSKELMMSSQLLVHFDPSLEIRLACDASAYGIGAVMSHRMPDGSEKPVGFVSRTLTEAEKKYSQIEKEGLACVFGITRFHSYLFGHHFILQTDHEPLRTLFNESKAIPAQASNRIQRWALKLSSYDYTIACRKTDQHANADAMSRLPLPYTPANTPVPAELVLMVETLQDAPVTATEIAMWTRRDPLLSRVVRGIMEGWPERSDDDLRPFWTRRLELSVHNGCILWGGRVVIPKPGQEVLLVELHGGHPGASRMKALARGLMWWPGMDKEIEEMVKCCSDCQQSRSLPPPAPLHPWSWPTRPWARLHMDFAGPMEGRMYLLVVDAHSKWLEVLPMRTTTAEATIHQLRTLFARFGIPETIVSDNGPQFTADVFEQFCKRNGIHHVRVAPYHPASNGLAERMVQTFKQGFRKLTVGTVEERIARFLLQYRTTPHTTTGVSPAELLQGRRLRTRLEAIRPSLERSVEAKVPKQKENHDRKARERRFVEGERVYARNFRRGQNWLPGHIEQISGPVSFQVRLMNGSIIRRHQDHIRKRETEDELSPSDPDDGTAEIDIRLSDPEPDRPSDPEPVQLDNPEQITPLPLSGTLTRSTEAESTSGVQPPRRYPSRVHHPPARYSNTEV